MRLAFAFAVLAVFTTVGAMLISPSADADDVCAPDAPRCPAPPPQHLTLTAPTPDSLHVDWQSATGEQTSVAGFRVTISELTHDGLGEAVPKCLELTRDFAIAPPGSDVAEPAPSNCSIESLVPGSRYEVAVEETNTRVGSFLAKSRITMPVHGPIDVTLELAVEGNAGAIVTWTDPVDMTGIAGYYVTLSGPSAPGFSLCNPPLDVDRRCSFADLDDGNYLARVRSVSGSVLFPASASEIVEISFEIGELANDRCSADGEHSARLARSLKRIDARYDSAVQGAIEEFVHRPKKLASELQRQQSKRTRRTARANAVFEANCPPETSVT